MSNLLWKKKMKKKRKKKWKPKQKQKATGQWKWRKRKTNKKKKKERENWRLLNTAYGKNKERKKERTDIFSKIDSTSLHRLKKKRRKENWIFLNCDCDIVLTCCKVENFFEFEFKGDIRNFFFLFILWNLTKTINRGFYSRFTNICNYIDSNFFF